MTGSKCGCSVGGVKGALSPARLALVYIYCWPARSIEAGLRGRASLAEWTLAVEAWQRHPEPPIT